MIPLGKWNKEVQKGIITQQVFWNIVEYHTNVYANDDT